MNSKKVYYGLCVVLVLLGVGLVISVNEANSLLTKRSNTLVGLKTKIIVMNNQENQLAQNKKEVATYSSLNQIAESVVPQDKDQAEAVREIVSLAAQSGISQLSSITFPASSLGGGASIATTSGLTQVTPVKGIAGVDELQITISQDNTALVPYSSFIKFLSGLEQNRRTAEVSSISINPSQGNPNEVSFTLTVNEFLKP